MKKPKEQTEKLSRRDYLKTSAIGALGVIAMPTIVPSTVFGKNAPSNKINVGQIGFGRIAKVHDLPEVMRNDIARVIAVCDVDANRANQGKAFIENAYKEMKNSQQVVDVQTYTNYRELIENDDIDAVVISTPDHWHVEVAMRAALSGKHIYMQKPASLTIEEGRQLSNTVHSSGVVFQIGSQQRSINPWPQFKRACELVRNGRIGELKSVKIGLPGDPSGNEEVEMPIPKNLDYDMWLGSTPFVYYTEKRVHPQHDFSRPGWLRCEQFGAGMITGWGAHHIDTAHWGMDTEFTGPVEIEATAKFPTSGMWNVHGDFKVNALYPNDVEMEITGDHPNGVRFEGTEGWIFVSRGNVGVTASDPSKAKNSDALKASDEKILRSVIGEDEIHLYESPEQHENWLDCIKTKQLTVAPVEIAHRSCSACLLAHTAMKIDRKLFWDPVNERFKNDDEANAMLSRPQRYPYGSNYVLDKQ